MSAPTLHLPPRFRALLAHYRTKLVLRETRAAFITGLAVMLALLLIGANAERWLPGDDTLVRWLIFAGWLLPSLVVVGLLLRRARHQVSDLLRLCHRLERQLGSSQENMASGYQLLHPGIREQGNATLLTRLENDAERLAEGAVLHLPPSELTRRSFGIALILFAVHAALCMVPGYQYPLMLARVILPWENLDRPAFTRIHVADTPEFLPRGDDLPVTIGLEGRIPERAYIRWSSDPDEATWESTALQRTGRDSFLHFFVALPDDLYFQVEAGDGTSPVRQVTVVDRPTVEAVEVTVQWPDYTGRAPESFTGENALDVRAVQGSTLTVNIRPSEEATTSQLRIERDRETSLTPLELNDDRLATLAVESITEPFIWSVELTDRHGFENTDREAHRITVLEDGRPQVRLIAPDNSMAVYPSEAIPLTIEADDDFGLKTVELTYRKNPNPDLPQPPERLPLVTVDDAEIKTRLTESTTLRASDLGAMPGDVLEVEAEASDALRQFGRSQTIFLRVIAFDPGREERIRIQHLRLFRDWLEGLLAVPSGDRAPWSWPLPEATAKSLADTAAGQGLLPLAVNADPTGVFERILDEQRQTTYPLYRADLRDLVTQTGLVLLDSDPDQADAWLTHWARQDLTAQINYRAVHNMLFALRTLRGEIARLADTGQDRGLDDFRRTTTDWLTEAGRILRDTGLTVPDAENNAAFIRDLSTALFSLDIGQPATIARLDNGLLQLETTAREALPALSAQLIDARQKRNATAEHAFKAFTTGTTAENTGSKVWARLLWESTTADTALAPAAGAWTYLMMQALAKPDPFQRNLSAADRFRRTPPAAANEAARAWLASALQGYAFYRLTPAGGNLSPADAVLEQSFYATQQKAAGIQPDQPPGPVPVLTANALPSFEQNADRLLAADLAAFAQTGQAWLEQIESIEQTLARFVPSTTLEMRQTLLAREDAFLSAANALTNRLRFGLRLGWVPDESAPLDRRAQVALLLAIEFRTSQFLSRAAESRGIFNRYAGEEYPASELELFATRINLYKGGALALVRLARATAPLGDNAPDDYDPTLLTSEAERIALIPPLYALIDRIHAAANGEVIVTGDNTLRAQTQQTLTALLKRQAAGEDVLSDPADATTWQNAVRTLARLDPPSPPDAIDPRQRGQAVARAAALLATQIWEAQAATATNDASRAGEYLTQALAQLLAPAVTRETGAIFRGARGTDPERQRLWLVDELRESERMPPPRRFPGETRDYLDHLRRGFRQHPHTR